MVAGKSQQYMCGTEAHELDAGGFRLSPLARTEFSTFPEEVLGHTWASVTDRTVLLGMHPKEAEEPRGRRKRERNGGTGIRMYFRR